jgi:hypothetical protein
MESFHNPELFQNSIVVDYARQYVTPGVKAIYWVFTLALPAILSGKVLACLLMGLGAYWCFRIGERLSGMAGGLAAGILFAASLPVADRVSGGNPRAFMFPLLAAWLCYLIRQEHRKVAVVAIVSAITYPMAFVLAAPVWVLDAIRFEKFKPVVDADKRRWIAMATGLVIGGAAMGSKYLTVDARFGPVVDRQRVMSDPAFRDHGRFSEVLGDGNESMVQDFVRAAGAPLGLRGRWDGESWIAGSPKWATGALAGLIVAWLVLAALRLAPLPRQFVYLAIASKLVYLLAFAMLFRLFVPTRYVQFSLPLLVLLGMALVIASPVRLFKPVMMRRIMTVACVVVTLGAAWWLNGIRNPTPQVDLARFASLWQGIEEVVPPDAVVAGDPRELDGLGAFCQRKGYMPHELTHPAYATYYDEVVTPRIHKTFDALYASSAREIVDFAKAEGVEYMLFNFAALQSNKISYVAPFDDYIKPLQNNGRPRALLTQVRPNRILAGFPKNNPTLRLIRISPGPDNAFGIE